MPIVPQHNWGGIRSGQIPEVRSVRPDGLAAVARLGDTVAQTAGQLFGAGLQALEARRRAQEAADQRAAREAQAAWQTGFAENYGGRLDEGSGEQIPGWRALGADSLDDEKGGAAGRFKEWNQGFQESEKYTGLSTRARELFDQAIQPHYVEAAQRVMGVDGRNAAARSQQARVAALMASSAMAGTAELDDAEGFDRAAQLAAAEAALVKMGTEVENPEGLYAPGQGEPEVGRLRFRSGEAGAVVFAQEQAGALEKLRLERLQRVLDGVNAAEDIEEKRRLVALARETVARYGLNEKAQAAVTAGKERVEYADERARATAEAAAARAEAEQERARVQAERQRVEALEDLLAEAAMEPDLDRRAELAGVAVAAAEGAGMRAKVVAAVKQQVATMQAAAQREENEEALAALVRGAGYEAGENQRRKAALEWARAKQQELRARELTQECSAQARELAAQEGLTAAMAGSGVWADKEGNVAPVGIAEQRSILRGLLASGQIREGYFLQEMRRLESVEARGLERQYEAAKGLVAEALGQEIATVHRAGKVALAASVKKPQERVANYRYMEDGKRRKAKLLAEGVPRLIEMLMVAERADGLMVDLDGNPQTGLTRLDAREYRQELLRQFKQGLLSVDLDTQYGALVGAVEAAAMEERILSGKAILSGARWGLPSGQADGAGMDNERGED